MASRSRLDSRRALHLYIAASALVAATLAAFATLATLGWLVRSMAPRSTLDSR